MTRRRHWTPAEKLEMLQAAFGPGGLVSTAMRRFEVTSGLLYTWRRHHRAARIGGAASDGPPVFARVDMDAELCRMPPLPGRARMRRLRARRRA